MSTRDEEIGAYLRQIRKIRKFTLNEAADRLGMSFKTVANYETGKRKTKIEVLEKFCNVYGISVDEVLTNSKRNDMEHPPVVTPVTSITLYPKKR